MSASGGGAAGAAGGPGSSPGNSLIFRGGLGGADDTALHPHGSVGSNGGAGAALGAAQGMTPMAASESGATAGAGSPLGTALVQYGERAKAWLFDTTRYEPIETAAIRATSAAAEQQEQEESLGAGGAGGHKPPAGPLLLASAGTPPLADGAEEPIFLKVYALPNAAIVLSYFCVGIALNFLSTPVTYYMIEKLDASAAQQNILTTVMYLPWSLKLFYGLLSDSTPLFGYRRKGYFVIGWCIFVLSNIWLAMLGQPGVKAVIALVFLQVCGFMLSDVMTDALIVERSKFETDDRRGMMQATGYIARFFGSFVGSVLGTVLYNEDEWGWGLSISMIFFLNAIFPLFIVFPFMYPLVEVSTSSVPPNARKQVADVWESFQLRAVYQPMLFVFIYNAFQIPNAAWSNFLIEGLDFTEFQIGLISIIGSVFSWGGLIVYKRYFFATSWRAVYLWTSVIGFFLSILQLLLIFRVNKQMGISDIVFAVGDDSVSEFVLAIQFLPVVIMYIGMCPDGAEGTTYAALTTLSNLAATVGYDIGTLMTGIWNVSNANMEDGNYTGMWKLTLLTSLLQPLPLVLLWMLPANKQEQKELQLCSDSSKWGGGVLVVLLFGSILGTVIESIAEIWG